MNDIISTKLDNGLTISVSNDTMGCAGGSIGFGPGVPMFISAGSGASVIESNGGVGRRMISVDNLVAAGHFLMKDDSWTEVHRDTKGSVILYHHPDWPHKTHITDDPAPDITFSLKA